MSGEPTLVPEGDGRVPVPEILLLLDAGAVNRVSVRHDVPRYTLLTVAHGPTSTTVRLDDGQVAALVDALASTSEGTA